MSNPQSPSGAPSGPPYPPMIAQLGGLPTPSIDDPISGVLLLFFVAGAAFHMTVFQINRKRDHKFILSAVTFGFCMARIAALVMRIVWSNRPENVQIGIAANIFAAAGVVLLFIVNLIFTQRLLDAYHPVFSHRRPVILAIRFLLFSVIANLIMVITVTIISFYTLDSDRRRIARDVQLFAGTYLALLAFLPIPITLASVFASRAGLADRPQKFGTGRLRSKVRLLLFTSFLLSLGAAFRVAVNYTTPRPANQPAWYHHRAAFYCFNFVIEIIVVYTYGLMRFDRRFHVADKRKAVEDAGNQSGEEKQFTPEMSSPQTSPTTVTSQEGALESRFLGNLRINSEAEAFGDDETNLVPPQQSRHQEV